MLQKEKRFQRERKILLTMSKMQYATLKQLQAIENLGGYRNANRILSEMERDKLIGSMRRECKIYYLANAGKERIGLTGANLTGRMVEHSLMRNDLYIALEMPSNWKIEGTVKLRGEPFIRCDAMFIRNGIKHYVEIDHKQTMRNNYEKIDRYSELSPIALKYENHAPFVIFYTTTDERAGNLEEYMKRKGVKGEVYKK